MVRLSRNPRDLSFPAVEHATPDGLLAIGGDLQPERLLEAYRHGIFPWYNEGQPILWWSPDPRTVLFPEHLHISRSLKRSLRPGHFTVTLDRCFETIVRHCAGPRPQYPEGGTWITPAMMAAYTALHEAGYAHSVERWLTHRKSPWCPSCVSCVHGTSPSSTASNPHPTCCAWAPKTSHATSISSESQPRSPCPVVWDNGNLKLEAIDAYRFPILASSEK